MLAELLQELYHASTDAEQAKLYKALEKVGMDKATVDFLLRNYPMV